MASANRDLEIKKMATKDQVLCRHCSTPVPEGAPEAGFCCRGCSYVYKLIHDEGLDQFYDLKGGAAVDPVREKAFAANDWTWLEQRVAEAEAAAVEEGVARIETGVEGVSCVGCLWLMERLFTRHEGGLGCETHPGAGWLRLTWRAGHCDLAEFARTLQQFGYTMLPKARASSGTSEASDLRLRLGLCAAFAMNAMAFTLPRYLGMDPEFFLASLFEQIAALSATLALLVGGSYFIKRAAAGLRHGLLHMDFPIALGVVLAWLGSVVGWLAGHEALLYFDFVAIFLTLMLGGRLLQVAALERHRQRAQGVEAVPREIALAGGGARELDDVEPGDVVSIEPGGVLPTGGLLRGVAASVSLEWINGEAEPRAWEPGRRLPGGAVNVGRRPMEVEVEEAWEGSLLKRLAEVGGRTTEHRPLLQKVLGWYVAAVLTLAALGGAGWLIAGAGWVTALQVTVSVLVVSCPCAIGLALPLADDLARSVLQGRGIFLRKADFFSRLAGVRTVVFDKTGTLTMERPELVNPEVLDTLDAVARDRLRELVGASLHPVSRRLLESLAGPPAEASIAVEEVPGQGLRLRDSDGVEWTLGQPSFGAAEGEALPEADTVLRRDGGVVAGFSFRDALRPESRGAMDWLRRHRFGLAVLSGDRQEKVDVVAEKLGLAPDEAHARMTPEAKRDWLVQRDPPAESTLFLGDGANDSLACAAAACSGTPLVDRAILEEKADFFFTGHSLGFLPAVFQTAEVRRVAIRRSFFFAITYNTAAISLCLAGLMHPLVAAVIMPLGSVIAVSRVALAFRRALAGRLPGEERPVAGVRPKEVAA